MPNNHVDQQTLIKLVQKDAGLSQEEKAHLVQQLQEPDAFNQLMQGTVGASIGYVTSKFLGLSPKAQVLLSIAGFGIGNYLKSATHDKKKFFNYNSQMKAYEMNYENR